MRKRLPAIVGVVLAVGTALAAGTGVATGQIQAAGPFGGYSTGTVVHADALQAAVAGPRVVDAEVAFSGASSNSGGLATAINNEMSQPVQPALSGKNSAGRGTGLELGLGTTTPNNPDANQAILAGLAESSAPPNAPLVKKEVGPVPADPVAYASLLRGQAGSLWDPNTCVIGQPLAFGLGYAADAQLLNTGTKNADDTMSKPVVATDTTQNARAVSQSTSFTYLVPNADGSFGVVSESHQTIAPVTLFKGTPNEVTIEALGEWVLRARASGLNGGAKIEYAPGGSPTPTTPVLRIIQPNASNPTTTILTLQQLLGGTGLSIPANPLVNITIGEGPRKIAAAGAIPDPKAAPAVAGDGTSAAAAVDVVRVNLLQPDATGGLHALDLRIGHMEAKAFTPAGGIRCTIPVSKSVSPNPVNAGQDFLWTITIPTSKEAFAPIACDLKDISAVDTIKAIDGSPKWTVTGASNGGVPEGNSKVTWANLGTYKQGDPPIQVTISGHIPDNSGSGTIQDTVNVSATLANCTGGAIGTQFATEFAKVTGAVVGTDGTIGAIPNGGVKGDFTLNGPDVNAGKRPAVGAVEVLPKTGTDLPLAPVGAGLLSLAGLALALRRRLGAAG